MRLESLRIAELSVVLSTHGARAFSDLGAIYQAYAAPLPEAADLRIHASSGPLPALGPTVERHRFWSAHRGAEGLAFACTGEGAHAGAWRVLASDARASTWRVITMPQPSFVRADQPLPDPLGFPGAELMVLTHVATRDAAVMHACGVVDGGRGFLFCGRSGAGKSTTARLWQPQATVLNDDRVLVRRESPTRFRMHGTPWHGDIPTTDPGSAPLCGVFFLEHAMEHRVQTLTRSDAYRRLLTCCWLPLWDQAQGLPQTLGLCATLAREVPCYRLQFRRDAGVRKVVQEACA